MTLSEPDDRAQAVGAANTLWFEGDTLRATNTDVEGFLANLDQMAPNWDQGLDDAIVLGAGGASRAIVYGLLSRGVKTIRLANRTFARAEKIARALRRPRSNRSRGTKSADFWPARVLW